MNNKIAVTFLLVVAILITLSACMPMTQHPPSESASQSDLFITSHPPTLSPNAIPHKIKINPTPTMHPDAITLKEVLKVLPARENDFKNDLIITVNVGEVKVAEQGNGQPTMSIVVNFTNTSKHDLVFRKPLAAGLVRDGEQILDLAILIQRQDGGPMSFWSSGGNSFYMEKVTLSDFIQIEPSDTYSFPVDITLVPVRFHDTGYSGILPRGIYKLTVGYENYMVGYRIPLSAYPPLDNDREWRLSNTMEVDQNAWVGQLVSNDVEFTIP